MTEGDRSDHPDVQPLTHLYHFVREMVPLCIPTKEKCYHFHIRSIENWIPFNCYKFTVFKVARYSFPGSIPLKFEHKLRRQKQSFGKIATIVVLDKDETLL